MAVAAVAVAAIATVVAVLCFTEVDEYQPGELNPLGVASLSHRRISSQL